MTIQTLFTFIHFGIKVYFKIGQYFPNNLIITEVKKHFYLFLTDIQIYLGSHTIKHFHIIAQFVSWSSRGIIDYYFETCRPKVGEFELPSGYNVHFRIKESYEPPSFCNYGSNRIIIDLQGWLSQQSGAYALLSGKNRPGTHFDRPHWSVHRSDRGCPCSSGSQSRCALTGIPEPQEAVPTSSNPPWMG